MACRVSTKQIKGIKGKVSHNQYSELTIDVLKNLTSNYQLNFGLNSVQVFLSKFFLSYL